MSKDMIIGWIGLGRMGAPMVEKVIRAGYEVKIWNRTKSKADALVKAGASLVDRPSDLANVDALFTMVSTGKDLREVYFGDVGVMSGDGTPKILVSALLLVRQSQLSLERLLQIEAQNSLPVQFQETESV